MSRIVPKEVSIFEDSCSKGHNFVLVREPDSENGKGGYYYKEDKKGNHIRGKLYAMLYCTLCAATKEIVAINRKVA